MFKLALLQMFIEAGDKQKNLSHAREMIEEAAANKADLALLPEALDLGWTDASAQCAAGPIPNGRSCQFIAGCARENNIFICSGLVEKCDNKIFNSAVIINRSGEVIAHHRKLNELEIAHKYYSQGDRLSVCHTGLGTLGLMICADAFARDHVISRSLGYMGVDVILSPCAWAVDGDHDNTKEPYGQLWYDSYIPVAKQFHLCIAAVSNVGWITTGPWKGRKCIGCSLAIGSDGSELAKADYGVEAEQIIYVDIETEDRPARGCGWERYWGEKPQEQRNHYLI